MKQSIHIGSSIEIQAAERIFGQGGSVIDYFEAMLFARQKAMKERVAQLRKEAQESGQEIYNEVSFGSRLH